MREPRSRICVCAFSSSHKPPTAESPVWDSPRLLNAAANALFVLAIALVVYGAGRALVESRAFPLRTVRVLGDLQQVGRPDVVHALQGKVEGTFFTADLDAISALFR